MKLSADTRILFFLLLLLLGHSVKAQVSSELGRFEVPFARGCSPFTVPVQFTDNFGNISRQYFFTEGSDPVTDTVFTYQQPGIYPLVQVIGLDIDPKTDTLWIEVLEPVAPQFTILNCLENSIRVAIEDDSYDSYEVFFTPDSSLEIGSGITNVFEYSAPGAYTVKVQGKFNGAENNCGRASKTFQSIDQLLPGQVRSIRINEDSELELALETSENITYLLEYRESTRSDFELLSYITNEGSKIISDLDPSNNSYCFRLVAYDACSNTRLDSETLCSLDLTSTNSNQGVNLQWSSQSQGQVTEIQLSNDQGLSINLPGSQSTYLDNEVTCDADYCYRIIKIFSDGRTTESAPSCIRTRAERSLPRLSEGYASVEDGSILIHVNAAEGINVAEYIISRSRNQRPFSPLMRSSENEFIDVSSQPEQFPFCYRIQYEDICGNQSREALELCPVFLQSRLNRENSHRLSWSAPQGSFTTVRAYRLEAYDEQGSFLMDIDLGTEQSFDFEFPDIDAGRVQVRIAARIEGLGTPWIFSNFVPLVFEAKVNFPNAFTPDGDGLNDTFRPVGLYFEGFELQIFNRWGELLFLTSDPDTGWDGSSSGKQMPEGSYMYRCNYLNSQGERESLRGTVLLLRKR